LQNFCNVRTNVWRLIVEEERRKKKEERRKKKEERRKKKEERRKK